MSKSVLIQVLRKFWLLVLLLVFLLLFSFSKIVYHSSIEQQRYTLLFPSAKSSYEKEKFSNLYAEQRKIPIPKVLPPGWNELERKIYYVAKELLYGPGPAMIRAYPFVPVGTRIESLAIQKNDLYIDFNPILVSGESEHYFETYIRVALIEKVLRLNFPKLDAIYFTVGGLVQ